MLSRSYSHIYKKENTKMKPNNFLREAKLRLFEKFNYYPKRDGDTFDHSKLIISNKRFVEDFNWCLREVGLSFRVSSIRDALLLLRVQGHNTYFYSGTKVITYDEFEGRFFVSDKKKKGE